MMLRTVSRVFSSSWTVRCKIGMILGYRLSIGGEKGTDRSIVSHSRSPSYANKGQFKKNIKLNNNLIIIIISKNYLENG